MDKIVAGCYQSLVMTLCYCHCQNFFVVSATIIVNNKYNNWQCLQMSFSHTWETSIAIIWLVSNWSWKNPSINFSFLQYFCFLDLPCEQRQTVPACVRHQVWRYLHPQLQVLTLFINKGYFNPTNFQSWTLLTLFLRRQETKQECGTVTETTNEKVCDGASEPKCSVQNVKECVVKNEQQCQSVNDRWGLDSV